MWFLVIAVLKPTRCLAVVVAAAPSAGAEQLARE